MEQEQKQKRATWERESDSRSTYQVENRAEKGRSGYVVAASHDHLSSISSPRSNVTKIAVIDTEYWMRERNTLSAFLPPWLLSPSSSCSESLSKFKDDEFSRVRQFGNQSGCLRRRAPALPSTLLTSQAPRGARRRQFARSSLPVSHFPCLPGIPDTR